MDIKGAADLGAAPVRERRDLARDVPREHEVSPGVIVEIGRPSDMAGTYNARGVIEGPQVPKAPVLTTAPAAPEPARLPLVAVPTMPAGMPEALRVPANAQVQTLANASPQVAVALKPTIHMEATHLHPPPAALTAGIQTLARDALQQAEKGNAAAQHEEEADPLRKEKDPPRRDGRRPSR